MKTRRAALICDVCPIPFIVLMTFAILSSALISTSDFNSVYILLCPQKHVSECRKFPTDCSNWCGQVIPREEVKTTVIPLSTVLLAHHPPPPTSLDGMLAHHRVPSMEQLGVQSRAQRFSGSLSAVGRREKLWDNGIFVPEIVGHRL